MILAARDPFGRLRQVYDPGTGEVASSIAGLLVATARRAGPPDRAAILGYRTHERQTGRTVLRDVRAVPPGHALVRRAGELRLRALPTPAWTGRADTASPTRPGSPCSAPDSITGLEHLLAQALARALDSGQRLAVALSGGLDSALLLALLHSLGASDVPAYILVTGMPDYCERDAALAMADRLGARVRLVSASADDFVRALPRSVNTVEEPLFNLHPVAKRLLAEAMAADGIQAAITGDGADQVVRRDTCANYLPLCQALFDAAGVKLVAPFLDPHVVRCLLRHPPDADKPALRAIAARLALPDRLVRGPKHSRLAPPMDLAALVDRARVQHLARALDLPPPDWRNDADTVQWTTLSLVLDHLDADTP